MTGGRASEGTIAHRAQAQFEPLSDTRALHGESPVWSFAHQAIWWVDVAGRKLLRTTMAGQTKFWDTPEIPGFVQCLSGDVMVGMQSGIFRFDLSTSQYIRIVHLNAPGQRFNDACTDAMGRIWAGTMDIDNQRDDGVLYLFDPTSRTLTTKIDGFRTINGLAWDDARNRLYVSDSHPSVQTVWTCEVGSKGGLGPRRDFASFHNLQGRPDGAALDHSGQYWIAGVGGGSLYRFSPCGQWISCFSVPPNSPTKPAFPDAKDTAMVLTSFEDDTDGGRLSIWRNPPLGRGQENHADD